MTLGLKFLLWTNRNFDFKKTTFRYLCIFNCNKCILMRLWVKILVSQGWVQSEITVHTIMEQKTEGGGGIKDMELSGVLEK